VRPLGLANAIFCPHLNESNRQTSFTQFMAQYPQVGIGIENHCAIEIIDGSYRIITSKDGAEAYRIYRSKGTVVTREIAQTETPLPLAGLLTKR
jgi:dipeptidase E